MYAIHEWMKTKSNEIASVSYFANCIGRVYVEASSYGVAEELLKSNTMAYTRYRKQHPVPMEERRQLVEAIQPRTLEEFDWVRVLKGEYAGDIAHIQSFDDTEDIYELLIVPRLPPNGSSSHRLIKRRRTGPKCHPRKRLPIADAIINSIGSKRVKIVRRDVSFEFDGDLYNYEGLMYLHLRHDEIQLTKPTLEDIKHFVDATVERIVKKHEDRKGATTVKDANGIPIGVNATPFHKYSDEDIWQEGGIHLKHLTITPLMREGDAVEVLDAKYVGMTGKVIRAPMDGVVGVEIKANGDDTSTYLDIAYEHVRLVFRPGDNVRIRGGVHSGKTGIVETAEAAALVIQEAYTHHLVSELYDH